MPAYTPGTYAPGAWTSSTRASSRQLELGNFSNKRSIVLRASSNFVSLCSA